MRKKFFQLTPLHKQKLLSFILLILGLLPYGSYLAYVLWAGQGPVDYQTFMSIGERFLQGKQVYVENSYYPLPYVMIFAFFRLLPTSLSLVLWLATPVLCALFITRGKPWVLIFAPLYAHFVGGQSSLFGMLSVWGYKQNLQADKAKGGIFLALTLLKPQLAIFPTLFALWHWMQYFRSTKKLPAQLIAWICTALILYAPAFVISPHWLSDWAQVRRPFSARALAGLLPRLLLSFELEPRIFLLLLLPASILLWIGIYRFLHNSMPFEAWLMGSFLINPLIHDYDLIQLIPLLQTKKQQWLAQFASLPGWLTILFAYQDDTAWFTFSLIAPVLLVALCCELRQLETPVQV
ncbi:MAG: hypothetical protein Kow0088_20630 [Anaerolineales bacterium]